MATKNPKITKKTVEVKVPAIKQEFSELSKIQKHFNKDQLTFVKNNLAPTLNADELLLFLYRSHKLNLNPLNGEIFAYASYETVGGEKVRKMVVIVGRDGKRRIAAESGELVGIDTQPIYINDNNEKVEPWAGGKLWGARSVVTRVTRRFGTDDDETRFAVTVPLSEYTRGSRIWQSKPETMIKKVAESQALSLAFPVLVGVYDESERWDNGEPEKVAEIEGGNQPATEEQLETVKTLGGSVPKGVTKSEAAETIRSLTKGKSGKK